MHVVYLIHVSVMLYDVEKIVHVVYPTHVSIQM